MLDYATDCRSTNLRFRLLVLGAAAAVATACVEDAHASEVQGDLLPPPTGDAAGNTAEVSPAARPSAGAAKSLITGTLA